MQKIIQKILTFFTLKSKVFHIKADDFKNKPSHKNTYSANAKIKTHINIKDQIFCIVDIETNGSSPKHSQIIEIGAIKFKHKKILDKFSTLISCKNIPEHITKITNIDTSMLKNTPNIKQALCDFRLFLEDCLFVAHNVNFDYGFISKSMQRYGIGTLKNRKLCTIDLAKRTISAQKYGLNALCELLNINRNVAHRAYSDAYNTFELFQIIMQKLPSYVNNSEDLIKFSKAPINQNILLANLINKYNKA